MSTEPAEASYIEVLPHIKTQNKCWQTDIPCKEKERPPPRRLWRTPDQCYFKLVIGKNNSSNIFNTYRKSQKTICSMNLKKHKNWHLKYYSELGYSPRFKTLGLVTAVRVGSRLWKDCRRGWQFICIRNRQKCHEQTRTCLDVPTEISCFSQCKKRLRKYSAVLSFPQ